MDRDALVLRNRKMAEAFHHISLRHRLRRSLLQWAARIPIIPPKSSANRIVLIRPDHLGDVLLSIAAIRALRQARPHAEIHALVGPWSAEALANITELDVVLTMDFPGFNRSKPAHPIWAPYEQLWRASRQLRMIGYGSAIIMRRDHWWGALLAYLAGIPERIGYDQADVTQFLTDAIPIVQEHAVEQNLRLVQRWTGVIHADEIDNRFHVDPNNQQYIDDYLLNWRIEADEPIICIHPGAGAWSKLWQEEKWATVADTLSEQLNVHIVFTGGEQEAGMVQRIAAYMRYRPCIMVGDTRVDQLAALYKRAKVVLGPDSGPLHLAAAVGTPTVALFGPADPLEFRPWGNPKHHIVITTDIACRPCRVLNWGDDNPQFHPCVREITIGQVLDAARRVVSA